MNLYSQPPAVVSDVTTGFDRVVTYAGGVVRTMRNFFLPAIDDPNKGYLARTYSFGRADDSFWLPDYQASLGSVQLSDDFREGNDRIAIYTDGTQFRSVNWYVRNPAYSNDRLAPGSYSTAPLITSLAPPPPPMPENPSIDGLDVSIMPAQTSLIPPSSVTLPPSLSATNGVYVGPVSNDVTNSPTPISGDGMYLGSTGFVGPVDTAPVNTFAVPPSLVSGLGNLVPGVPNVPSTGPVSPVAGDGILGGSTMLIAGAILAIFLLSK